MYCPTEDTDDDTRSQDLSQLTALASAGIAGAVFSTGLRGVVRAARAAKDDDVLFVQMSDSHWGFADPKINPESEHTLVKAVAAVNALAHQPAFVVFTCTLTHTTDDADERRRQLARFKSSAGGDRRPRVRRRSLTARCAAV